MKYNSILFFTLCFAITGTSIAMMRGKHFRLPQHKTTQPQFKNVRVSPAIKKAQPQFSPAFEAQIAKDFAAISKRMSAPSIVREPKLHDDFAALRFPKLAAAFGTAHTAFCLGAAGYSVKLGMPELAVSLMPTASIVFSDLYKKMNQYF